MEGYRVKIIFRRFKDVKFTSDTVFSSFSFDNIRIDHFNGISVPEGIWLLTLESFADVSFLSAITSRLSPSEHMYLEQDFLRICSGNSSLLTTMAIVVRTMALVLKTTALVLRTTALVLRTTALVL